MRGLSGLFGRRKPANIARAPGAPSRSRSRKAGHAAEEIDLARLSAEIDGVARYVARLRREISFLRGNDIFRDRLPAARVDVADARSGVNAAVTTVLTHCEKLLVRPEVSLEQYRAEVESRVIAIMEACCFEDLLSQRLTRADDVLEYTMRRLQRFALAVGIDDREHPLDHRSAEDEARREMMLIGPQAGGEAPDQAAIDRLFD